MNCTRKNTYFALCTTLMLSMILLFPHTVKADDKIPIDENNFPDSSFRWYVEDEIDKNEDDYLSSTEIAKTTSIDVQYYDISNLKGIEYFTSLECLDCSCNSLKYLDLSHNKKLKELNCSENSLTTLDISSLSALTILNCGDNKILDLNVSNNKLLKAIYAYKNQIKKINVSNNIALEELSIGGNKIKSIDVSRNTKLKVFYCGGNELSKIDISNNTSLVQFGCFGNNIELIDISSCPKLVWVYKNGAKTDEYYDFDDDKSGSYYEHSYAKSDKEEYILGYNLDTFVKSTPKLSMKLNYKTAEVECGQYILLEATIDGSEIPADITWTSSDKSIAGLDDEGYGYVIGNKAGVATITGSVYGVSATCKVTVLYNDVTNNDDFWYFPTNYLTAAGIVKGYDNQTLFYPENECTRAQMVTFLWRLNSCPKPKSTTTKFKDIKSSDYFYKPVLWAVEKGITTGVSKTKFNPQGVCTRAQTVTFLWRMAGKTEPKTTKNKFSDVKKTDYFYKAVLWASEKKIVAGYSDGTFKPQGKCLRRQMVTFLYKYDKYINGRG